MLLGTPHLLEKARFHPALFLSNGHCSHFLLDASKHLGIRTGFDFLWLQPRTVIAFLMGAVGAGCAVFNTRWKFVVALMTSVVRYGVRSKCVARVPVWVLVSLGTVITLLDASTPCWTRIEHLRVSWAVSTPNMCTFGAIAPTTQENDFRPIGFQTLAACPPDPLPNFLEDQLRLLLCWPHDHYRLHWSGIWVRPDSCVSGPFPQNLVLPLAV